MELCALVHIMNNFHFIEQNQMLLGYHGFCCGVAPCKSVFAIIRKMHFWNKGFLISIYFSRKVLSLKTSCSCIAFFVQPHISNTFWKKSHVSSSISTNKHTQKKIAKKLHHLYDYGYDKSMSPYRLSLHSTWKCQLAFMYCKENNLNMVPLCTTTLD